MTRLLCLFLCLGWSVLAANPAPTYLVYPFTNQTGNPGLDWLGEAFAESIQEALSAENLLALDRDERQAAGERMQVNPGGQLTLASMLRAGEMLNASNLIYGSYAFDSASPNPYLEVVARVIDLPGRHITARVSHKALLNEFSQSRVRIAWEVLAVAEPVRTPAWEAFAAKTPLVRADAIENHIRGLLAPNDDEGHRFWAQAARLDESFWPPRFHLARVNWRSGNYRAALRWLESYPAAQPRYLQARFLEGLCLYAIGDFARARDAFAAVAEDMPVAEVLNNLGAAQSRLHDPTALQTFERALQAYPNDPDYQFNVAYLLWKNRDFQRAAEQLEALLEATPDDPEVQEILDRAHEGIGPRPQDASVLAMERLKDSFPEFAFRQLKQIVGGGQ